LKDKNPVTGKDKIIIAEIYAFDSLEPLKCYITNHSRVSAIIK
jgi:hypothetical protein